MKGVKQKMEEIIANFVFENLVSYERCKAKIPYPDTAIAFENLVSYERCKALTTEEQKKVKFENLVSYERCKAIIHTL